jgi:A/G-specific adenine glycosylase
LSEGRGVAARVLRWHATHGRHDLPWSTTREPYRVWLSEVMLQQTQVATVLPYYARFLAAFPDVRALAAARQSDVLKLWAGLGYYSRARNLHACARAVVSEYGGEFPRSAAALATLPGIGRSTAAAIAAFCFYERVAILDGNVKRVLARYFGVDGYPGAPKLEREMWTLATSLLPGSAQMPAYTQALMDLGATVCMRSAPRCDACPLRTSCVAFGSGRVDSLPTPRPVRATPVRRAYWLVVFSRGRVLLQRQPQPGLWGGLLAPLQFKSRAALIAAATRAAPDARVQAMPERRHAFTHFTLRFVPYVLRAPRVAQPGNARWLPLSKLEDAELPTPAKRLLLDIPER